MGTKANPGQYDSYAKAKPDEPIFVLLARDPMAPILIRMWAAEAHAVNGPSDKIEEALKCAESMDEWRARNEG